MNKSVLIQVKRGLFDYFKWSEIERKYEMKLFVGYYELEEQFINDLLKHNVIVLYVNNEKITEYQQIKDKLLEKEISFKDRNKIRKYFKSIYDNEINDNSEYARVSELVVWN